jgi:hypothetical protein
LSDDTRVNTTELIYERLTDRLIKELIAFSIKRSRELRWRTGSAMDLPGGETPQSIVSLAIVRAIEGTRRWNPETNPDLGWYLKGVIRSLLNHLATGRENTMFESTSDKEDAEFSDVAELNGIEWLTPPITPEESLLAEERLKAETWAASILDQASSEDAEVSAIIKAIRNGCDPRSDVEMSKQSGLTVEDVRKAKKRLNRLIDRVANRVRQTSTEQPITSKTTTNE